MFFVHLLGKTTADHVDNGALPTLAASTNKFMFSNHVKVSLFPLILVSVQHTYP